MRFLFSYLDFGGSVMDMELTQTFLRGKNPCAMGYRWFVRNNLGGKDYQSAMDAQIRAGRIEDARWLLQNFGPTHAVMEVEHLEAEHVVFAGTVIVHGDVRVPGTLLVGRSIKAGAGIRAGQLEVGEDLHSGGAIFADSLQAGGLVKAAWSVETAKQLGAAEVRCGWELRSGADADVTGAIHVGQDVAIDGALRCGKGLRTGSSITVQGLLDVGQGIAAGGDIDCGNHIQAGWGIRTIGHLHAACSIRAGESLHAEGEICAGEGYGIYAGMNVQMQAWPDCAWVRAERKPKGLVSGWWHGHANEAQAAI